MKIVCTPGRQQQKHSKTLPGVTNGAPRPLEKTPAEGLYLVQQRQKIDDTTVFFPSVAELSGFVDGNILDEYNSFCIISHRLDIENKSRSKHNMNQRTETSAACVRTHKVCYAHQRFIKCDLKQQQGSIHQTASFYCDVNASVSTLPAYRRQEILAGDHVDLEP